MNTLKLRLSGRLSFGFIPKKFKPGYVDKLSREDKMRLDSVRAMSGKSDRFAGIEYLKMGLSSLSNSEKTLSSYKRGARGLKGMTTHGRLLVKDAATWLQKEYGKARLSFWTVTIPPECLNQSLISQWSRVIELLKKKLLFHLKKRGLPPYVVGVTEIQPSRWLNHRDIPPLHLHILFVGAKRRFVPIILKQTLDKLWEDCLENFSGVRPTGNYSSNVQFVRKDAAGYLGKYMSKGSSDIEGLDSTLVPKSWYFCTRPIRLIVVGLITKLSGEFVNELYEYFRKNSSMFRFTKTVEIPTADGFPMVMGWYGELIDDDAYDYAWNMIRQFGELNRVQVTLN